MMITKDMTKSIVVQPYNGLLCNILNYTSKFLKMIQSIFIPLYHLASVVIIPFPAK